MRAILISVLCLVLGACAGFNPWAPKPPAYVVFFDSHSTTLSPDGKDIVAHAAVAARLKPGAMVQVAGPSTKIALGFTQPRIDAVVAELLADGVAEAKIVRTSLTTAAVKVDSTGAQRVEIRIVEPGS